MREFDIELDDDNIKKEFKKILSVVEEIDEMKVVDYFIIDGNEEEKIKLIILFKINKY